MGMNVDFFRPHPNCLAFMGTNWGPFISQVLGLFR